MTDERPAGPPEPLGGRSRQRWGAFAAGAGVAFLLSAALVEQQLLTPRSKAWVSMLGALCIAASVLIARWGRRSSKGAG